MPTTVLAQNDAGIGVKNGVNWGGRKNFVGTFAPPFAVLNDLAFLETLTARYPNRRAVLVALAKTYQYDFQVDKSLAVLQRLLASATEDAERAALREESRREQARREALKAQASSEQSDTTEAAPEILPESLDADEVSKLKAILAEFDRTNAATAPPLSTKPLPAKSSTTGTTSTY